MEKTITFNIPKGYVIDKENSTDTNIVLKLTESTRVRTWEEYCEKMRGKNSYYINNAVYEGVISSKFRAEPMISEFEAKEDAEAFAALSKLLKLRKDWVGEWKPDWGKDSKKYTIYNYANAVSKGIVLNTVNHLSFPTEEMRNEFFDCFKDFLEQAKALI